MEEEWQQYQVKPGEGKSPVVSILGVSEAERQGRECLVGAGNACLEDEALTLLKTNTDPLVVLRGPLNTTLMNLNVFMHYPSAFPKTF